MIVSAYVPWAVCEPSGSPILESVGYNPKEAVERFLTLMEPGSDWVVLQLEGYSVWKFSLTPIEMGHHG